MIWHCMVLAAVSPPPPPLTLKPAAAPGDHQRASVQHQLDKVAAGSGRGGEFPRFGIDPAHRGCGVSRQLLQHGEQWCRSKGCTEIATDAELDNTAAQRFHEHMGFEETFRVVEYRKSL